MAARSLSRIAAVAALGLALGSGAATAQIAASGGPIAVGARTLEIDDTQGRVSWIGDAEATQGQNRLRAGTLHIYYGGSGRQGAASGGRIERMVAEGNVYFVTPTQVVRGDNATYTAANDSILVTGDVILTQGENVVTGSRLTVNVATGQARMESGGAGGRRVQGVFYPSDAGG